ncbi:MAG: 16S rRNA (uracil(1498)-N(3))-methyltransferase [Wolbachia endosymbiont of Fragariocoptes setiger]|nr:16S rRNA (uracil(1498)-N(3))-methyltransferase [Wolbachia endosymbiont of Fragariocoptes setiger]
MKKIRIYVEDILVKDTQLTLNLQQSHYINNVMRLEKGYNILLFNGKNGEWLSEITDISRHSVKVRLKTCLKEQEYYKEKLFLYCAVVKSIALNKVVRQATEMGVTCIQFILTKHTVVKNINIERAKLQAIEAAEQCERMDIPEILPPIDFHNLLSHSQNKNFILCDKTGDSRKFYKNNKDIALIIGPEGGFSNDELEFANKLGQKLSLGKTILRVDTAVVASLAYLAASDR